MVGVPRTTGCQPCKSRRTRCDEKWPRCSPCRKRGNACPGPTALIKFVHGGQRPDHKGRQQNLYDLQNRVPPGPTGTSSEQHGSATGDTNLFTNFPTTLGAPSRGYRKFRLYSIPGKISSPDDVVASRLVSCLETNAFLGKTWVAAYMQFMPSRVPHNTCLRDIVNLFCCALGDFRKDSRDSNIETMKLYGKALRTLQTTLTGTEGKDLNTLASIVLLNRTEFLFDSEWKPSHSAHREIIIALGKGVGQPKAGDRFHSGVLYQPMEDLAFHSFTREIEGFSSHSPWKEWLDDGAMDFFPPELQPFGLTRLFREFCARGPVVVAKVRQIHQHPNEPKMQERAMKILAAFDKQCEGLHDTMGKVMSVALQIGELGEATDPTCLTGTYFEAKIDSCSSWFPPGLAFLIGMIRICYDLSILYDLPNAKLLLAKYQRACAHVWMFIPHLLKVHKAIPSKALSVLILTYEAAKKEEVKDRLEEVILKHEKYFHQVPGDKQQCREWIVRKAKVMTGRLPLG